ncbi:MAG: hypothetical protein GEU75_17010 [Dehalococcoidia bacterium]|nr:hypothetical protein [Dehalococcoidia bacterium]
MKAPAIKLQAEALDWLSRLPLLGAYELGLLLGITNREADRALYELETLHWVEAVTAPSPELDAERFHALSPEAVSKQAERLGVAETEFLAELPLGKREIMLRRARIETTAGLNRFAAELAADVRRDEELELGDFWSLPRQRKGEAWWPPEVEGFGWLRSGPSYAPFFVAWDRAAAPLIHRQKRVAGWYGFREAEHPWGRDDIPPILVLCPSEAELADWTRAVLASADRRMVRPLRVLPAGIDAAASEGPLGPIWRRPGGTVQSPLTERLAWRWEIPNQARGHHLTLTTPLETLQPPRHPLRSQGLAPLAKQGSANPGIATVLGVSSMLTDATEKRILEWLAYHPLLSADDIGVLLRTRGGEAEPVLRNLARIGLVDSVEKPLKEDGVAVRGYFLTYCGLQVLAFRDGVPPHRYARYGVMAAAMPAKQGGGRLQTLLRQLDHTVGINRLFVRMVRDGDRNDAVLVRWLSASEAALQFKDGDATHWLRPDGAGDLYWQGRTRRFYLEWDRGTMRWPQMDEKCRMYAQYYAWLASTGAGSIPDVLIVTTTTQRETAIRQALDAALQQASHPPARIFTSVAPLIDRLGPFAAVWRDSSSTKRRTWP